MITINGELLNVCEGKRYLNVYYECNDDIFFTDTNGNKVRMDSSLVRATRTIEINDDEVELKNSYDEGRIPHKVVMLVLMNFFLNKGTFDQSDLADIVWQQCVRQNSFDPKINNNEIVSECYSVWTEDDYYKYKRASDDVSEISGRMEIKIGRDCVYYLIIEEKIKNE